MKISKKTVAWLLAAVMLVGLVIASSLWSFSQTDEAANARNQTRLLMNRSEDLLSALKDAETGQRGFLLTGNEAFLAPYLAVRDGIHIQLANLRELVSTDAARRHLDVVAPLVTAKLTELSQVIALYRQQHVKQALALVSNGEGKRLMDAIRSEMKDLNQLLEVTAAQHDSEFRTNMRYLLGVIVAASLSILLAAIAFAILAYRESQQRLKNLLHLETQHSLEIQQQTNLQLQHANITLQISEEKLAVTLNSIGDGVIATDAEGRVTLINPLAQQLTGWTQAQANGQTIEDVFHIIHQDTRLPAPIPVKDTLALGTVQALANHTVLIARDGKECPIADSCAPIRDRDAQVVGAVLVFRDVTQEYAAQRALQEKNLELESATMAAKRANLAKSEFLATMSHEIRTPMNGVIGMIDVLQQSSLNGPQMEMTNIIHDSAFALLTVINDILDFSKIEANKLDVESIPMSILDVVESACENMNPMALKKDVELTLFVDPAIPATVLGDPGRLRQVLINLTNNAIKFSSGQQHTGRVSVRALLVALHDGQADLAFQVADNGIGIDEATRQRLFSAFIQADTSTTRNFGGTGLGLAISGQLVDIMGGDIVVQSTPGQGSLFSVRLPFKLAIEALDESVSPSLVAGLSCLVMAGMGGFASDIASYLAHGQAVVQHASDVAAAQLWMDQFPDGICLVTDSEDVAALLVGLRGAADLRSAQRIRFVVIGHGQRRRPRLEGNATVLIDANLLTRKALLKAVAIAAGRSQAPSQENPPIEVKKTAAPMSREEARLQGRLILVAEDNEYNQKVILQQLMLLGRTADIANNGQEALTRWATGAYAILITDLHMPLMDGYELTAAIRAAETSPNRMPIIAFTANALKGEAERCKAIGMDDYLSKPVQLVQLKAMLKKWQPVMHSDPIAQAPTDADGRVVTPLTEAPDAVDIKVLAGLIGNEPAVIREFMNDFSSSSTQITDELRTTFAAGDTRATGALAHKLKSSARAVGAMALGELCAAMEQAGKANDAASLVLLLPRFEAELLRVNTFLHRFETTGA
jgi:PAS domain S-box-containing protein